MDEPIISVIIPFYGDPAPTLQLIDSLTAQVTAQTLEIIVSDDASPIPFPNSSGVTVIRRTENGGFARAVHSGAAAAAGRYLLILNSDLQLHNTFIEDLWKQAAPWMPAVVGLPLLSVDGSHSWTGRHFPRTLHYTTEWLTPLARFRNLPLLHEMVGHDTLADGCHDEVSDWVVGALMFMPRAAYRAVDGMDRSFYMNSEEVDLQRRFRASGLPSVILGGLSVTHEGGGSSVSDSRTAWMVDGRKRYERKWRGLPGLARMEIGMLAATAVNLFWNSARRLAGTDIAPWTRACWEVSVIRKPETWVPQTLRASKN